MSPPRDHVRCVLRGGRPWCGRVVESTVGCFDSVDQALNLLNSQLMICENCSNAIRSALKGMSFRQGHKHTSRPRKVA